MVKRAFIAKTDYDDCSLLIGPVLNSDNEALWVVKDNKALMGFLLPQNDWVLHALLCNVIDIWDFEAWAKRNNLILSGDDFISGDVVRLADNKEDKVRLSPVWVDNDGVSHMIHRQYCYLSHLTSDGTHWSISEEVAL